MTTTATSSSVRTQRSNAFGDPITRSRPDLPSWFAIATTTLYAACAGSAAALALLEVAARAAADSRWIEIAGRVLAVAITVIVFSVGGWCYAAAQSRRVDPTTPQLHPIWFILGWLIPVANIFIAHRMFGDLWASTRWHQSNKQGAHSPLAPRPWIISWWALAGALLLGWSVFGAAVPGFEEAYVPVVLVLSMAFMVLLAGVIRTIARELAGRGHQAQNEVMPHGSDVTPLA